MLNSFVALVLSFTVGCQSQIVFYWLDYSKTQQEEIVKSVSIYNDARSYYQGEMGISDDERSFDLLDKLTDTVSDKGKQSFYFYLFNEILKTADSALSESIGPYCARMILSSPRYVLYYLNQDRDLYRKYIEALAYEYSFELNGLSTLCISYEEFCKALRDSNCCVNHIVEGFLKGLQTEIDLILKDD